MSFFNNITTHEELKSKVASRVATKLSTLSVELAKDIADVRTTTEKALLDDKKADGELLKAEIKELRAKYKSIAKSRDETAAKDINLAAAALTAVNTSNSNAIVAHFDKVVDLLDTPIEFPALVKSVAKQDTKQDAK